MLQAWVATVVQAANDNNDLMTVTIMIIGMEQETAYSFQSDTFGIVYNSRFKTSVLKQNSLTVYNSVCSTTKNSLPQVYR